ncbi:MAG: sigma-70 family RNA polymerase sigma factor [Myxococcota bacterium]|nr:sigma-70 family RNA polymerase sigma factor [Myxococcota bacterium]
MSQAISDNEVVARAVEGDEAAFEILFQRYYGYAVRTALPYVKSSSDANDVAQDAFVRVHRNLKKFRQEARFTTWLHRIVTNLSIDFLRKQRRLRVSETGEVLENREPGDSSFWGVANEEVSPYDALERQALSEQLNKALGESAGIHREVLVLRELLGYSYDEIAATLNIHKGTVMSRLFHGRRKLKKLLEAERFEESTFGAEAVAA